MLVLSNKIGYLIIVFFASKLRFFFCHSGCHFCYSELTKSEAHGSNQNKASHYQLHSRSEKYGVCLSHLTGADHAQTEPWSYAQSARGPATLWHDEGHRVSASYKAK